MQGNAKWPVSTHHTFRAKTRGFKSGGEKYALCYFDLAFLEGELLRKKSTKIEKIA